MFVTSVMKRIGASCREGSARGLRAPTDDRSFLRAQDAAYEIPLRLCHMPGGVGTLDEMFEALTPIQTGKNRNFPIVLMGLDYWVALIVLWKRMAQAGTM